MATPAPKKGLGKGLAALMSDDVVQPHTSPAQTITVIEKGPATHLPVSALSAGKYQPRRQFDDDVLHELADSIEKNGIMQPLVVRAIGPDRYEIIAGERRFRAAKMAKLTEVPVIIREVDDAQALEMALIENIQRADLNPLEEAAGYRRLMDEFHYTQEKLASVVGKSRSHVANLLRLLDLPEGIKKLVDNGQLTMGHARALLNAPDAEALAKRVVAEGLNVRQAEALAAGHEMPVAIERHSKGKTSASGGAKTPRVPAGSDSMKTDEVREIENMLAENLGLRVSLATRGTQSGEVVISYDSLAQLDEILRRLGGTMY